MKQFRPFAEVLFRLAPLGVFSDVALFRHSAGAESTWAGSCTSLGLTDVVAPESRMLLVAWG